MLSDIAIAQQAKMLHIKEIAAKLGVSADDLEYYGKFKAKLPLSFKTNAHKGKLVLVTAMTPTPAGEGKTTTSIGLADGMNRLGHKTVVVLREPSLGPVFGLKGGAAGGGYAQVIPMEDINLHFTGDFSAVEKANNLLAAMIDNHLHHKKSADGLDPRTVVWKRVMDMNDRSLRQIVVGLGGKQNGLPREDGFHITPASEIMAILCMAEDFIDLKKRLANIYIGQTYAGDPVFAKDLKAVGAMAVLLKDAIQPNLVQTLEGNPAIIHGGPFASIAQGTNTVIATKMGLSLADWVITEAGFAADLGAEKFFDIKCKSAGLQPVASVLVVTIRALRHHGGALKKELTTPNINKVKLGMSNVEKHIENIQKFDIQPLVAINMFPGDTEEETQLVIDMCKELGVQAIPCTAFAEGGKGAEALAAALVQQVEHRPGNFQPLYNWNLSIEEKIHCVATEIYGAKEVAYSVKALSQLAQIKELGFSNLPVCIAKTPKSLSDDDRKRGRPEGFTITVREFELSSGAGFVIPVLGEMMRMPGLPQVPAAEQIDIDEAGTISGMF